MDPLLFKEAMANRIFSRIGIAPGHGLYINVLVLGYMFYNNIFRFFELVPHSRKLLAFEGTPLEEMAQGLKFGVQDGAIIVKEKRSAMLGGGTGRGVELVGRRAEKEWHLQGGTGSMMYPGTIIKVRPGSVLLKYDDDGTEAWVAFPCKTVRLLAVTSYALEDFCSFENIRKNGYSAIKAVSGGGDYAVPYKITAEYSLKINKRTKRITEQCRLVIDSVTVLHGTTIAWANSQRPENRGCLSQEQRAKVEEVVRYFPRRARFHMAELGSEELRRALASPTHPLARKHQLHTDRRAAAAARDSGRGRGGAD